MQFAPAVSIAPVGARVRFVNNDTWDHHVRANAAGLQQLATTGGFEFRLAGKTDGKAGNAAEVAFDKAGPVQLGCHLHGSMRGHVYVTDSPFTAKTDAQGQAQFDGVPEGAAQLRVWHADQLIDLPTQALTLSASASKVSVQLQVVPRRRRI